MPLPVPFFEIFVYSFRIEGIHLRGGPIARGGLRWSDRKEDFRTEVLGLMKAQMTKNSVIVPTGAKGGFIVKNLGNLTAAEKNQEVIDCYRILIRGLLDITDNYALDKVVKPERVVCYDQDDPYLVVAADKGTATFSDFANALSSQYDFWLGDALASGGSVGYDHKAMGITARGAWESVKHHFELSGHDINTHTFTVMGIGGMSGDVFGNGMLLSDKIKLLGVFDHENIFLDPAPDPEQSFAERKRLFNLPRSSWRDYDTNIISKGGGVYSRSAKVIKLSSEIKMVLDIEDDRLTPNELIQALFCAPVDLIWNGGIGTYVKASHEQHVDVGDRVNDAVRVDAAQLRCQVVGEGGNLGFTQLGRIEYALKGGRINTDSIDNSAGVDCSDHEVNIKILLNAIVKQGDLTEKQRDQMLKEMTDEVAVLVLEHNYQQNHAITMIVEESVTELPLLKQLITLLEANANLDRKLEWLPDNESIDERKAAGTGLTRPEVAVLLAYSKQHLKSELLADAGSLDQDLLYHELLGYFPTQIQQQYPVKIQNHRLASEIVANRLVNSLVNRLGILFPYHLKEDLGCSVAAIINTYKLVNRVFAIDEIWKMQTDLDGHIDAEIHAEIKRIISKTIGRSMYWFLRTIRVADDAEKTVRLYVDAIDILTQELHSLMPAKQQQGLDQQVDRFIKAGATAALALKVAQLDVLFICLNMVKVHEQTQHPLHEVASIMFFLLEELNLSWLSENIALLPKETIWASLARQSMRDEFNNVFCQLTSEVILQRDVMTWEEKAGNWLKNNQHAISHYRRLIKMVGTEDIAQLEKIAVILKYLNNILAK